MGNLREDYGNYRVTGSKDSDGASNQNDNEFEVTVICVSGDWFVWPF